MYDLIDIQKFGTADMLLKATDAVMLVQTYQAAGETVPPLVDIASKIGVTKMTLAKLLGNYTVTGHWTVEASKRESVNAPVALTERGMSLGHTARLITRHEMSQFKKLSTLGTAMRVLITAVEFERYHKSPATVTGVVNEFEGQISLRRTLKYMKACGWIDYDSSHSEHLLLTQRARSIYERYKACRESQIFLEEFTDPNWWWWMEYKDK